MLNRTTLTVLDPIKIYLEGTGNIITTGHNHLYPEFPPLPNTVINGTGGYYGSLNTATHNLYEELPCCGVLAEAVRHSVSNDLPGPYVSILCQCEPKSTRHQRREAKELASSCGITADQFPSDIPNCSINVQLILQTSSFLAKTSSFKTNSINYFKTSPSGALAKVIKTVPQTMTARNSQSEISAHSTARIAVAEHGASIVFGYNQMKEAADDQSVWCCINATDDHPIPIAWITNRNDRRNIPPELTQDRFKLVS